MTTPTPNAEAVEAAMKWAKDIPLSVEELDILCPDRNSMGYDDACRILAAEVERLRAEVQRLEERLNEEISHSKEY